jgi:hypothetical protein
LDICEILKISSAFLAFSGCECAWGRCAGSPEVIPEC